MSEPAGWQWIEAWRNGTISNKDFASLQKLLREQPDARRTLRRYIAMDTALRDRAEARLLMRRARGCQRTKSSTFRCGSSLAVQVARSRCVVDCRSLFACCNDVVVHKADYQPEFTDDRRFGIAHRNSGC